jgi:hypothetical protein
VTDEWRDRIGLWAGIISVACLSVLGVGAAWLLIFVLRAWRGV